MLSIKKSLLAIVPAFCLTVGLTATKPALSQSSQVLNLYSARHYQTDEALYAEFTKQTGIKINRIEADDNALLERLRSEGKNSPADVILLVDAARLWRAEIEGFFQPIRCQQGKRSREWRGSAREGARDGAWCRSRTARPSSNAGAINLS